MIPLILIINTLLRLFFVFYGYIANEEGILLYNQKLAYAGSLPFIDYDAWSSLFHDYLLGWQQFLFGPSVLAQRFLGLILSLVVFGLTITIVKKIAGPSAAILAALLLTFSSPRYLYGSTVPYSEQFMTLFVILSLYGLVFLKSKLVLLSILAASLVRSQALPITGLVVVYLFMSSPRRRWPALICLGLLFIILALLPFLLTDPPRILWAFFWPLTADKVLVYQQENLNLTHLINFTLETVRDYGLLLTLIIAGLLTHQFHQLKYRRFSVLLLLIIASQILITLIHRPPYASYLYPSVPMLVILTARFASRLVHPIFLTLLLILNFILFPHAQFIKTNLTSLKDTPHSLLNQITADINTATPENSTILAFYVPPVVLSHRKLPTNLNRGPFSISQLNSAASRQHHLTSLDSLRELITHQEAAAIILTSRTPRVLGANLQESQNTIDLINQYYSLAKTYDQVSFIEDPKTKELYLYLPRRQRP